MFDSTAKNQPGSSFILNNFNKNFSNFVPADYHRANNQLLESIGVKSHGTITFADNKSNRAEFIRIPQDASVMKVKELLNRQWCRERPSLVISVTGGARDFNMKPKLLAAFRRGLHKVARTTGAWIITGGMNTGIMKLVGDIVQTNPDRFRPIHLIGIATWGCVAGRQQLDVLGTTVQYTKPHLEQKNETPIEPNHTEFIFVDDGSERKYGGEIEFRARLEEAISDDFFAARPKTNTNSFPTSSARPSLCPEESDPIPVVLLVVEGGPNTVRTVYEVVVLNNIPAVFFEGTGRCCDLFAKAYHLYNEYRPKFELNEDNSNGSVRLEELKNKLREELKEEIFQISGGVQKETASTGKKDKQAPAADVTDYFEQIFECVHTRTNFLNVVSLDSRNLAEPDIDLAILHALLRATSGGDPSKASNQRKREQFHLALQWNRVDVVKNFIMKDARDWEKIDLNDMFELALKRNQTEFVQLFLDHDFSLTGAFRNKELLPSLYFSSISKYHMPSSFPPDSLRIIYEDIIQPSIGHFFEVDAALCPQKYLDQNRLDPNDHDDGCLCGIICKKNTNDNDKSRTSSSHSDDVATSYSDNLLDVDKELFIWSVITGRRDFNLIFWSRGKNKICAALFAVLIHRKRAQSDNDNSYCQSADDFEKLAVQILNRFYEMNPYACAKAIIRQIPAYGNVTWLELAIKADAKEFMAQRAVQDVLNNIWYGHIDHRETLRSIVFSTIMIWYSGFLRYHNELVKIVDQRTFLDELFDKSKLLQQNQTIRSTHKGENSDDETRIRLTHINSGVNQTSGKFVPVHYTKKKNGIAQYFRNILKFMHAPYVKFLYNLYFYLIFLLLFSYMLLCNFYPLYDYQSDACPPIVNPTAGDNGSKPNVNNSTTFNQKVSEEIRKRNRPAIEEYILAIWVFTLLCEEIRQFMSSEARTFRNKIREYFEDFWNILDFAAIVAFYIGFALRFVPATDAFCAARIILSVDLAIWYLRILSIFAAVKQLGPKLVIIGEMTRDLKVYASMLIVFVVGYGVAAHSLIHGSKEFSWHIIREIINLAYWQMFGELNVLESFADNYKANAYAVFILLVIYMAIISILLVNLLIAMFSNTFDRLQNDTDRIWKFQRYSLICEYLSRPTLPPPFILITHIWRFTLYGLTRCIKSSWLKNTLDQHTDRTKYKIIVDEKSEKIIEIAEEAIGDEVYSNSLKFSRKSNDINEFDEERVQSPEEIMLNKIRTVENRMQTMNTQQVQVMEYLDSIIDGLRLLTGDQIKKPERIRLDPDDSFDESNSTTDQFGGLNRRGSLIRGMPRQSSTQSDDIQSSRNNLLMLRRT